MESPNATHLYLGEFPKTTPRRRCRCTVASEAPNTYLAFTTVGMVGYRKMQTPWGAPAK